MSTIDYFQVGRLYECSIPNISIYSEEHLENYIDNLSSVLMVLEIGKTNNINIISNIVGWINCPAWAYTKYFKQVTSVNRDLIKKTI